ncbi:MAG: hypothetical protein WDO12_14635 [Pseudomonadota bacterium]
MLVSDSQLPSQWWLMKRDSLPAGGGVDHRALVRDEQEGVVVVDVRAFIALVGFLGEMRSPKYSIMRVPLGMSRRAKQPKPCTGELRTMIHLFLGWTLPFFAFAMFRPPPAP